MTILLTAALLPPLVLMVWVYQKDKVEREPVGLIVKLLIFGVISTFGAIALETAGTNVAQTFFGGLPPSMFYALYYFIVVALSEEFVKYMALKLGSWNSPDFNYTFDAILYGAAAALGFAAFENIGCVAGFGLQVAALRAVTAIPGHCIFGIYMGYYYGMAKFWSLRGQPAKVSAAKMKAILIPTLLHGAYDYCASSGDTLMTILFFVYIIILDIFAIRQVKKMSEMDMPLDVPGI